MMTLQPETGVLPRKGWTAQRHSLLIGAALSAAGAGFHVFGATNRVLGPIHAAQLPEQIKSVIDLIWWQVAALIAGGGIAMGVAAFRAEWRRPLAWLVGGHYLAIAAICLALNIIWFGTPLAMFQWIIFGVLAAIAIWAARR